MVIVDDGSVVYLVFTIINPWRMREGYSSRSVFLSVCLSVTMLVATYLIYTLKARCY